MEMWRKEDDAWLSFRLLRTLPLPPDRLRPFDATVRRGLRREGVCVERLVCMGEVFDRDAGRE